VVSDGSKLSPKRRNNPSRSSGKIDSKCIQYIDARTLRLSLPDGYHAARKTSVAAVDDKIFSFDKVFDELKKQEDVYSFVSPHVRATIRGYNTTIFAYGNTGSGKTFTMTGTSSAPGIIPRAVSEMFSIIEATTAQEKDVFFYVRISYVELYNNNFRNLLEFASKELGASSLSGVSNTMNSSNENIHINTSLVSDRNEANISHHSTTNSNGQAGYFSHTVNSSSNSNTTNFQRSLSPTSVYNSRSDKIEVRESQSTGVFLAGPNLRIPVTTAQEAFQLIAKGNKARAVGSTMCNEQSSRWVPNDWLWWVPTV